VTRYAIDEQHGALIAAWATGDGDTATTVATLPPSSPTDQRYAVARALVGLSEALWRTYTHPASAAGDDMSDNSEGWRRQGERDAFAKVLPALVQPNLPEDGMIMQSYVAVEEGAHCLGRALHAVGDEHLTAAISAEVQAEIAAIEQAELGDLSGRSRQAVVLTRADASPVQVAAADRLLRDDPLGQDELFTTVDPTAAAVAAAHWLHAAATVAAEAAGQSITGAIVEADDVQALPVATLTIVLDMIEDGSGPYEAVTELIRDAMAVAEGDVPDPIGLAEMVAEVQQTADRMAPGDEDALESMLAEVRTTPLDPARPALDLLEDLLVGIEGCAGLFTEYADESGTDVDDDTSADEHAEAHDAAIRSEFLTAVREYATAHADRIL
jgi:hypothetical protein